MEPLKTKRFILNSIKESDVEEIYDLRSDKKVLKHLGREAIQSREETLAFIAKSLSDIADNQYYKWAIRYSENSELLGTIGIFDIKERRKRASIGYALRYAYHRKGIMSECLDKVLDFAFENLDFHSIEAETDAFNIASQTLLTNKGFRKEAHFTEDYYFKGEFSDSFIYSLLERWRK